MRTILTVILALVMGCLTAGCTSFHVDMKNGTVTTLGGALVGRKDNFTIKHEWIEEGATPDKDVLHEITISRNTEEDVSAQQAAIQALVDMAKGAQAMNVTMFEAEMAAKAASAAAAGAAHE